MLRTKQICDLLVLESDDCCHATPGMAADGLPSCLLFLFSVGCDDCCLRLLLECGSLETINVAFGGPVIRFSCLCISGYCRMMSRGDSCHASSRQTGAAN